jgi:hypothetical protein
LNISILRVLNWIVILYIFSAVFIQINLAIFYKIIDLENFCVWLSVFLFAIKIVIIRDYLHFWDLILIGYRFIVLLIILPSKVLNHSWTWHIGIMSRCNSYNILSILDHVLSYWLILVQVSRLHCVVQILFIAVVPGVCAVKIFSVGICDFWRFNLVAFVLGIELIFVSAFYADLLHAVTCYCSICLYLIIKLELKLLTWIDFYRLFLVICVLAWL